MGSRGTVLYPSGFHGDIYLQKVVRFVAAKSELFIETGTNVASTLHYFARTNPGIDCFSCEPDKEAFLLASKNVDGLQNVHLYNQMSQDFLKSLAEHCGKDVFGKPAVFWLDAHGWGFEWPLKYEIRFITENFRQAYIFIDDFLVPGHPEFEYDSTENAVCSFDYVKDSFAPGREYQIIYPDYTEHTSTHHPLVGWILISSPHADLEFPDDLNDKVKKIQYSL